VEIQRKKKVGYGMEKRVKFECGIWLRNGNFIAVNYYKQKIKHQLNLQRKWTNGIENFQSERCDFKNPFFMSD